MKDFFHAVEIKWVTLVLVSGLLKHGITAGPLKLCDICVAVFIKRRGPPPEFQWLHKYASGAGTIRSSGSSWSGMDNAASDSMERGVDGLTGQDESLTDAVSAYHSLIQVMVTFIDKTKIHSMTL
jgi:hypothetical protein